MLATIIRKELKAILLSPKFAVTFAACTLLILLSVAVGIQEYQAGVEQYEAAQQLNKQALVEQSWGHFSTRAYRPPDPMQIFVSGIHNDLGRLSAISQQSEIKLQNSIYSDDPLFAVFRFVDFRFIVMVVLSLFAILFTYDAVNGEREGGTLQLTFSNPVPRAHFILGKFAGSWLGLVVPLLVPVLLSVLLVMLWGIPMTGDQWSKLAALLGVSLLFFTFFICFGVLMSCLARRSSVSFLLSLVAWVFLVLIVPRAGVMAAGQLVSVPSVAEVEARQDGFGQDQWTRHREGLTDRWRNRRLDGQKLGSEGRTTFNKENMSRWMMEDNQERKKIQATISEYARKLNEDRRNRLAQQERLAFTLSRFSPASAYQLAVMNLASTDIVLKPRSEDAMQAYKEELLQITEQKAKEQGQSFGRTIAITAGNRSKKKGSSSGGFRMSFNTHDSPTLDPSEVPSYDQPVPTFRQAAAPTMIDLTLLALYSLASFAGAFVIFLRSDVR